jgi:hypothetical protein
MLCQMAAGTSAQTGRVKETPGPDVMDKQEKLLSKKRARRGKHCSVPAFTAPSRDAARDDAVPARRQSPGRLAAKPLIRLAHLPAADFNNDV